MSERPLKERLVFEGQKPRSKLDARFGLLYMPPARKRPRVTTWKTRSTVQLTETLKSIPDESSALGLARSPLTLREHVRAEERRLKIKRRYSAGYSFRGYKPEIVGTFSADATRAEIIRNEAYWRGGVQEILHGSAGITGGGYWGNADAPEALIENNIREPSLINPGSFPMSGPWYGNYVGPFDPNYSAGDPNAPPPLTPVDRAAFQHDFEYSQIYREYGFDEISHPLGWFGNLTSLDPGMQLELAWSDIKLIGRSWGYFLGGLFDRTYRGNPWAAGFDLAWAVGITLSHIPMVATRLAQALVGIVYHNLRGIFGQVMDLGERVGGPIGNVLTGSGYVLDQITVFGGQLAAFSLGVLGGTFIVIGGLHALIMSPLLVVGGGLLSGAINLVTDVGEAVGDFLGNVGDAVGDFVDDISDGCYITTAVLYSTESKKRGTDLLRIFRNFRDDYVLSEPDGHRLMRSYYATAPAIVEAVENRPDREGFWQFVQDRWLNPAARAILLDEPSNALLIYRDMVSTLGGYLKVQVRDTDTRKSWKKDRTLGF